MNCFKVHSNSLATQTTESRYRSMSGNLILNTKTFDREVNDEKCMHKNHKVRLGHTSQIGCGPFADQSREMK